MSLQRNVISLCDDVINDIIHAHVAGHMTFWYKRGHTPRGIGSVTWDLQEVGPLKVHIGIDPSGESLRLEPTAFNCI